MTGGGTRGSISPWPGHDLLKQLQDNPLEEDYRTAAEARGGDRSPAPGGRVRVLGVVAVFGLLLGISAVKTAQNAPLAQEQRAGMIAQIQARQKRLDALEAQLRSLQGSIADLQTRQARQGAVLAKLSTTATTLGVAAGTTPVHGPGVVITTSNATTSGSDVNGTIGDTDLQALINGLWAAGAEAIAVNGNRITPLTAIRLAGQAITVDYRSLTPPYVIRAVGDPDTLPARLLHTAGGQLWLTLRANFGIRFDIRTTNSMQLPGERNVSLLWAKAPRR